MIFVTYSNMLVALLPVILIEAVVYTLLLKVRYRKAVLHSSKANLVSTLFGFPLAWLLLLGIELVALHVCPVESLSSERAWILGPVFYGAWLPPFVEGWLVPLAILISLVLAYFLSVLIEYQIIRRQFDPEERTRVKAAVWRANSISYGVLIFVVVLLWPLP